jgi:hypothetical protein
MKKGLLATNLFGLFGCVEESSDLYFSALFVFVHESREPNKNVVNDTLQMGTLMHTDRVDRQSGRTLLCYTSHARNVCFGH